MFDYITQLGLKFSSGEQVDVCALAAYSAGFPSLYSNGQLMDITDLLANEGAGIAAEMGEYLEATTVNGRVYALPPYRNYASANYLLMRKDILEQLGMEEQARNFTTWSEAEELFARVKDETGISPLGTGITQEGGVIYCSDDFSDYIAYDGLVDFTHLLYCDEDNQISLLLENDMYRAMMERVKKWYDNKWIYQDAPYSDQLPDELIAAGVEFGAIEVSEMGVEKAKAEATGYEIVAVELSKNVVTTNSVNKFGLAIPTLSEEPEAAMRWLNELYTNPDIENLLVWGEEGVDYVINDQGEADYPEGIDAQTVPYHELDFFFGNYFIALPWAGNGSNFRQEALDYLNVSEVSPILGFSADTSEMGDIVSAISSVHEQYSKSEIVGCFDDELYNEYITKLHAAEVDEYIAELQSQLNDFAAGKQ